MIQFPGSFQFDFSAGGISRRQQGLPQQEAGLG